jgi:hypothetical protein
MDRPHFTVIRAKGPTIKIKVLACKKLRGKLKKNKQSSQSKSYNLAQTTFTPNFRLTKQPTSILAKNSNARVSRAFS